MGDGEVIYRVQKSELHTLDHSDMIRQFPVNTVIHGDYTLDALDKMERGSLFRFVSRGWQTLRLEAGNHLQRSAWPQIIRGHDTFIIGLKNSGKTLSYLSPICAMIMSDVIGWEQLEGTGPVAIIFVHNSYNSNKVEVLAQTMLNASNKLIQCQAITDFKPSAVRNCAKGVEIIITTPELFLAKSDKVNWLKFDRLKFFVIDDAHYSLSSKKDMVTALIHKYKNNFNKDNIRSGHPQIIVCGSEWNKDVEWLYWGMPRKSTVLIGSMKSAIPYGKIKCEINYVEPAFKLSTLINQLDKHALDPAFNRIIVVCKSSENCREVYNRIADQNRYSVHLCSGQAEKEAKGDVLFWNNAPKYEVVVFVVNDEDLKYFKVKDANYLIHYDIEDSAQQSESGRGSIFFNRFMCLFDRLRNITEKRSKMSSNLIGAKSDILITTEEKDLDRIVKTFSGIGLEVPDVVLLQASQLRTEKEFTLPLCQSLKNFGHCESQDFGHCLHRHSFSVAELKMHPLVPRNAKVEFLITNCSTVNSFIGQIVRYSSSEVTMDSQDLQKELGDRHLFLKEHFAIESNKCPPESIEVGSVCVVNDKNVYTRGKILKIMTKNHNGTPNYVKVFCIDTGDTVIKMAQVDLFKLPESLKDKPQLAVEVILVGVVPPIKASEFSRDQFQFAQSLTLDKTFKAKVCMSIGNIIWVSSMTMVSEGNVTATVRTQLVENKFAALNPGHEDWIATITSQDVDPFSDSFFVTSFYNIVTGHQWAFIPISAIEEPTVEMMSVSHAEWPNCIFANVLSFADSLKKLNEDIQAETKELVENRYKQHNHFICFYTVGRIVLVEHNNMWRRCVITEVTEDEDMFYDKWGQLLPKSEYTFYTVFLVDYGQTFKKIKAQFLFPILKKFVTRLPFQAIWLNLSHVIPIDHQWRKQCGEYLLEKYQDVDPSDNLLVMAKAKDVQTMKYSPSYVYDVFAFTLRGRYDELGEELVDRGFAKYVDGEHEKYMLVKENLPKSIQTEIAHDYEDNWDVYIPEVESQEATPTKDADRLHKKADNNLNKDADLTTSKVKVATPGDFLIPTTRWRQTSDHIIITVCVSDMASHSFEIGKNRELKFSCAPNYKFEIQTFGFLSLEKETLTGQHLQTKFLKQLKAIWPRLTRTSVSLNWLRLDFNDLSVDHYEYDESELPVPALTRAQLGTSRSDNYDTDSLDEDEKFEDLEFIN